MSKQDLITAICSTHSLLTTILSNLISIHPTPSSPSVAVSSSASIELIRSDFISLSLILNKSITNLGLALKSQPAILAGLSTLLEFDGVVKKILFCIELSRSSNTCLGKEIEFVGIELFECLISLLSSFRNSVRIKDIPTVAERDNSLKLIGICYDKIEIIKKIPKTELESSLKTYENIIELLQDCLNELTELLEPTEAEQENSDSEDDPLTPLQTDRIKQTINSLRLAKLLLNHLINSAKSNSLIYNNLPFLANSITLIKDLSANADEAACAIQDDHYPIVIHHSNLLFKDLDKLSSLIQHLITTPDLAEDGMTAVAGKEERKKMESVEIKWQSTFRNQLIISMDKLSALEGKVEAEEGEDDDDDDDDEVEDEAREEEKVVA